MRPAALKGEPASFNMIVARRRVHAQSLRHDVQNILVILTDLPAHGAVFEPYGFAHFNIYQPVSP